jgi:hypothetical protein
MRGRLCSRVTGGTEHVTGGMGLIIVGKGLPRPFFRERPRNSPIPGTSRITAGAEPWVERPSPDPFSGTGLSPTFPDLNGEDHVVAGTGRLTGGSVAILAQIYGSACKSTLSASAARGNGGCWSGEFEEDGGGRGWAHPP